MLLLIILFLIIIIIYFSNKESFGRISGKWCINCNKKSYGQCMDCFNCGFCVTDKNKGYCTPGTVFGPTNLKEKCQRWIHNDDFSNNLNRINKCKN